MCCCALADQLQWAAGQTVQFYIQLIEEDASNTTAVFDDALEVTCSSDAPAGSSFCLTPPSISMAGPGCYMVLLRVGTVW